MRRRSDEEWTEICGAMWCSTHQDVSLEGYEGHEDACASAADLAGPCFLVSLFVQVDR